MKSTTLKSRQALKKQLIWGDVARIARMADVDRQTVDRWFNGESNNHEVGAYVQALMEKRNEKIEAKVASLKP